EANDVARRFGDRLARPDRDRDVARRRRDLRRPEAVEITDAELAHLAGEEGRRHDDAAVRGEVEGAVRCCGNPRRAGRTAPSQRIEGGAVAARHERTTAREGDMTGPAPGSCIPEEPATNGV